MIRRFQLSPSKFRLTLFSFHRGGDSSNSYSYPYTLSFTFATPEQRFELQWFWWWPPPFCLCMCVCLAPFISLTPIFPRHPCNMHVLVLLIFDKGPSVIPSLAAFLDIVFVCVWGGGGGWGHPSKHFPLWLMEGRWGGMLDQTLRLEPLSAPLLYVITFSLSDATTGMPSDIYFSTTWDVFIGRDCIQGWFCRSIN